MAKLAFALPEKDKKALSRNPATNRGWDALGGQSLDGAVAFDREVEGKALANEREEAADPDLKEGWMIGKEIDETSQYWGRFGHGKNNLPSEEQVPGFRKVVLQYYDAILDLSREMMKIIALSLDLPTDTFDELCREPAAAIRLLHYPNEVEGATGAGEHTDFGFCTLLATSGAPGLEVFTGTSWVAVEPTKNSYIVNVGDLLSLYTGGEYKSSLHRVINKSGVERYSIPFFMDGNSDILVSPTRGTTTGKFKPITVEEHLRNRFDGTYSSDSAKEAMAAVVGA
ncbi:Clavaminate synthase-like protein [Meredithblackwellia eburnea MCA 4105]